MSAQRDKNLKRKKRQRKHLCMIISPIDSRKLSCFLSKFEAICCLNCR